MQRKSKLEGILQGKCPRCRAGNMFKHSAYNLSKFTKMHEHCPLCGLRFELEPGFFFGAMYISYAFSVAIFVAIGVALSVLGDFPLWVYIAGIIGSTLLLLPLLFRYSRILFLYFFGGIHFDAKIRD